MIRLQARQFGSLLSNQMGAVLRASCPTEEKIEKLRLLAMKEAPHFSSYSFARTVGSILIHYPGIEPECVAACLTKDFEERKQEEIVPVKGTSSYLPFLASSDPITIVHGGGLEYIQGFLEGKSDGYAFESGGQGVFVTPADHPLSERAFGYALRTPPRFFQTPCIMTAKIPANKLTVVNHNSDYEAVILPENRDAVTDIAYRIFSPKDPYIFKVIADQNMPAGQITRGQDGSFKVLYQGMVTGLITDDEKMAKKISDVLSKIASENWR